MKGREIIQPGQEKSPNRTRYETAKKSYFAQINNRSSMPSQIVESFSSLVKACYGIDFLSLESKTTSLTIFARTGMAEARNRGSHGVADSLKQKVQWLEDNLAISQDRYKKLPTQEGTPEEPTGERLRTYMYETTDGRVIRRSQSTLDDILILKEGHAPNDYDFTPTGLILPIPIAASLSRGYI